MHVLAVVGPESGRSTLVERLVGRLSDHGPVGTICQFDRTPPSDRMDAETARYRDAGAAETYELAGGEWVATGEGHDLDDALARLSPTCEYAVVEGFEAAALPKVVLGEGDSEREDEPILAQASSADAVDVNEVVDALEATEPYETLPSLVAEIKRSPDEDRAGAIATFTGRVRAKDSPDDAPTEHLEFEKYDGVAEERLAAIREELEAREGVYEVRLHHRTGVVEAGEDIVFVVVLAGHRTEAFATVEDGIDRLKDEVPLFKKEVTVEETFWSHER